MRTRDRPNFEKNKKLVRTTTISVALFVAAIMIFSSIPTIASPGNTTKLNKITEDEIKGDPAGLDPKFTETTMLANSVMSPMANPLFGPLADTMYAYNTYAGSGGMNMGPVSFPLDDPGDITLIADGGTVYFLGGGTWTCEEEWFGCEYNTGGLWKIDPETGDMENIGGGGISCNGLAWDPVYNRLYGTSGTALIEYDPETGEQTTIGSHGVSNTMIALVIDLEGNAYMYDVLFSGNAHLFSVDLETGEATDIADMGENLLYAQDGAFDRETGILWLAAYSSTGFLGWYDFDAEEIVHIGNFEGGAELACAMIMEPCIPPEHDVGVSKILKPEASGHAVPSMDMELLVKNYGANPETFDAQMEIIKCESSGSMLLDEDFSGTTFPPENWTTDYWTKAYSNYASGESPEANAYRYNYGGQTYDNYIQTEPFDATGWEKIILTFRWAFEPYLTYAQYCNFYVKYQKNETSPWKDVSPWDNPLNEAYEGDLWTIDCYGFGSDLGENFSIKFEFIGYYYYFMNFYLDEVKAEGCGGCAEYAELEEDISLAAGEETTIVFPGWQPSEWQNESFQDDWEAYPVHGFTVFEGDQRPKNNDKWMLLELYYPWFYDIEITEIGSPQETRSIPAQTFDVEATITNVGQFPACCIGIDIAIGEPYVVGQMVDETEWPTTGAPNYYIYYPGYANGWRDEHKSVTYYYGWQYYNNNYAGGDAPEAYMPYYYCRADYVFYSAAFDASEYSSLTLNFLTYINHFSGSGLYALEAGYSTDGENWYAAWHEEPSSTGEYEVSVPIEGGSETTYIGFWAKGNPYYFNYWYLDNVEVVAMGYNEEYTDFMCQGDDLEPGEVRVFDFDQWTPAFLEEEESGQKDYIAQATIDVEVDSDPGNDIKVNTFSLDYWHDSGIEAVTSPAIGGERGDLLWDNGDTDGTNGYSILGSPKRTLMDDFETASTWEISEFRTYCVAGPASDWEIAIWSDDDGDPGELILGPSVDVEYSTENTGRTWFGYAEWEVIYEFEPIVIEAGTYWVEMWSSSGDGNLFGMIQAAVWGSEMWVNYDDLGFMPGSQQFGSAADCNFRIYGYAGGPPGISVFIQPGTESIDALAKNYGTFQELDLTCYAEIWEYITDPDNGTLQYEDSIVNIDLDTPLGGTVPLAFNDFTFAMEGKYGLFLDMPNDDDVSGNNKKSWGVGVDDTEPVSDHTLDPAIPDGLNGWYVSDLEVTLDASDPEVLGVSSGVAEIKYQINGGTVQTITGGQGTFLITQADDLDDVEVTYWAIDNVGNVESPTHTFYIDMDQTDPTIDLTYEWVPNEGGGTLVTFTATALDATSGMDRVEFFLNDGLQSTVSGSGPTYQWSFVYFDDLTVAIRTDGYDIAGNMASDVVDPLENFEYNQNMQQQTQTIKLLQQK